MNVLFLKSNWDIFVDLCTAIIADFNQSALDNSDYLMGKVGQIQNKTDPKHPYL